MFILNVYAHSLISNSWDSFLLWIILGLWASISLFLDGERERARERVERLNVPLVSARIFKVELFIQSNQDYMVIIKE